MAIMKSSDANRGNSKNSGFVSRNVLLILAAALLVISALFVVFYPADSARESAEKDSETARMAALNAGKDAAAARTAALETEREDYLSRAAACADAGDYAGAMAILNEAILKHPEWAKEFSQLKKHYLVQNFKKICAENPPINTLPMASPRPNGEKPPSAFDHIGRGPSGHSERNGAPPVTGDGQSGKTTDATESTDKKEEDKPADFTNNLKMKFVRIPAGDFVMGPLENSNENKPHQVRITKSFYMQATEVTQTQWKQIMGANPSNIQGDGLPVEQVNWNAVQEFIAKLNQSEPGMNYRLPAEAEWEYACRAGSAAKYCFGDEESGLAEYAWYDSNSGEKSHPAGIKKPNAWGLYDMHGNVWEWCSDWFAADYYSNCPVDDPKGPATGTEKVLRGGCWGLGGDYCRSAYRNSDNPACSNHAYGGLRLCADSAPK
jgi:formylglycine-generating enzyme required for sulfatase activity